LWNRLHAALFVRVGPDGRAYGQDHLEPLLWVGSRHLLEAQSHRRALALLEEFLKQKGENLVEDPLKRAVLQRDLWLVFNWLEGHHSHFHGPALTEEQVRAAQDRLRRPLAAVIGRLALTADQIKKLPDNYAVASSGAFPKQFDPEHPDKPYLPADLFAADGPWVCVGRPDGPVAPEHLRETGTNQFTNSAFLVFLKLPAGRAATVEYLKQLRSFDQPLLVKPRDTGNRNEKYHPNPKLPPLPVGTETALVRRALLIARPNTLTATALTESVQLRVYREVPAMTEPNLGAALDNGTPANRRAHLWQSFHEFRLSRSLLFAGRSGGLSAIGPDERDFPTPFFLTLEDALEGRESDGRGRPFSQWALLPIKEDCFLCHSLPGVSSFNSYFNYRNNLNGGDSAARPFPLSEMSVAEVAGAAVKWKGGRPHWTALRKLLAE
jgi:hypothetical protein